jgi:hypothetical protein
MTALTFDSAWFLRRVKQLARRPSSDLSMLDADWYDLGTEAQLEAFSDLVSTFPWSQYFAPSQLTSSDQGLTYDLPVGATGHIELYNTRAGIPDSPLIPGMDFLIEANLIRIPNGRTRTFANGGPWFRGAVTPGIISAVDAPVLMPVDARTLIVYRALEKWASRPASGSDPSYWDSKYNADLLKMQLSLATKFNLQGYEAAMSVAAPWYLDVR